MNHDFFKKFSFPIRTEFIEDGVYTIQWFKKYQELISEIYLPAVMLNSFNFDAHAANKINYTYKIEKFLQNITDETDIKICLVLNDIFISEQDEKKLYNELVVYLQNTTLNIISIVCPSRYFLKLKILFPKILLKNTVLLEPTYNQVINNEYNDWDYIYFHDDIIHNLEKFLLIKNNKKFGCVVNLSNCRSSCQFKRDHYFEFKNYNNNSHQKISSFCPALESETEFERKLKDNAIPHTYSSYKKYLNVLDIYKLQGRRDENSSYECMKIIENVFYKRENLLDNSIFNIMLKTDFLMWENKIKNCSGYCNTCEFCDELVQKYKDRI